MKMRLAAGGLLLAQRAVPSVAAAAAAAESYYAAGSAFNRGRCFPLSERLQDAVELCCEGGAGGLVADIGCDHGHLAAELAKRGRDVLAVDISAAPLERARRHFEARGLAPRGFVLSDGLPDDAECETAIVAGVGALTAARIMRSAKNPPKRWIVQPVPQFLAKVRGLRRELELQGYSPLKEVWRDDNPVRNPHEGRFLVTILAEQASTTTRNETRPELELLVGRGRDSTDATEDARYAYVSHHRDWLASIVNVDSFPRTTTKAKRLRNWHALLDQEVARYDAS